MGRALPAGAGLFFAFLFLPFSSVSSGRTFVVAPNGSDEHPGTVDRPWRTLHKAAREAGPGDTVLVREGAYTPPVTLRRSGSQNRPLAFRNFPGETPVLTGKGATRFGIVLDGVRFVRVQGFEIREIRTPHPRSKEILHEQGAILLRESSDCVIERNRIATGGLPGYTEENPGATGIQLWSRNPDKGCHRNLIRGNEISHSAYGVHVRGPAQENIFEANYWHDNQEMREHSDGIKFESIDFDLNHPRGRVGSYEELSGPAWALHTPRQNVIRYNIAENHSDDGIDTWVSVRNTIEYNWCKGSGAGPKKGDGNGFKLGPGGHNIVRYNLSEANRERAFTDNRGPQNSYENNLALGEKTDGGNGVLATNDVSVWERHPLRLRILEAIEQARK